MFNQILQYLIVLGVFLLLDSLWIGVIAKKFYGKKLGYLMAEKPKLIAALAFYLLYIFGLMVFIINPALAQNSGQFALLYGGLLGMIAYATYDLTNLATVKQWPMSITIIDIIWGSVMTAMTCFISFNIISAIW